MLSSNSITVRGALKSAGAELVRSMHLPSGIVVSEWTGRNTLTEYRSSNENVLSIYLSGGENCSQLHGRQIVRRGFKDAVCLFPIGEGQSQWQITERLNFLHVYFDPRNFEQSLLQSLRQPPEGYAFREVFQEASPVISAAAASIALADWTDKSLLLGVDGLMSWILLNTFRSFGSFAATDDATPATRGRFAAAQTRLLRDYLNENLGEAVRLEDLASLVNLSRYHFLRKFKTTFGHSPHAFLTHARMSHAHHLLKTTTQKITTVALECGYAQHSQFTTAFRKHFGYPPRALRGG
ncbi:AraC family transcriptional regulator [Paraburkholderia sp. D15]|uniref:helix-turn-helix transcriptional regulator n=1 Tax=Paraburkholderia sp. D15 TaxID=2880218 RepID=UPI00247AF89C|nr:AraC family transcriptional regulator [Paraburkholderia sp. D15]WGS51667.1 AraC family transcriptional regulator [Paraburkholderia sp. D15]